MTSRFDKVAQIFRLAAEEPPEARDAILEKLCAGDESLRVEVRSLLAHDRTEATAFVAEIADRVSIPSELLEQGAAPPLPSRIGGYRPRRRLGEGGMGIVYGAQQEHPRRDVALKVIRTGLLTREMLRRFEYEAQLLARVNHPGIAQVYEAGVDRSGEVPIPFIAMEFIPDAKPLTAFADARALDLAQRIALFALVCDAVHHGHQKAIIHRDLKPSNLLVGTDGRPKVIDFGVARTSDRGAAESLHTKVGQLVGTLAYMSPEQCRATPDDLDTRSDVYALGVVLYELLTERLPYDVNDVPLLEAARRITEHPPTRPSSVNPRLRGDLDTILLKTLEKERDRRYQTAGELADELRRHLDGDAINARRTSTAYVVRRYVARRRVPFAIGAVAVVTALTLGASSLWQRHLFELEEANAAAFEAFLFSHNLNDPFEQIEVDLDAARAASRRAHQSPDLATEEKRRFVGGTALSRVPRWDEAEAEFSRVLELRRQRGAPDKDVASALVDLGNAKYWTRQYDEALDLYDQALELRRRLFRPGHGAIAEVIAFRAACLRIEGRLDESERLNLECLRMYVELGDDAWIAASLNNLGMCLRDRGQFALAAERFRDAIDGIRTYEERRQSARSTESDYRVRPVFIARGMRNVAHCLIAMGEVPEARKLAAEAMDITPQNVTTDELDLASSCELLAECDLADGDLRTAEELARRARSHREAAGANTVASDTLLARVLLEADRVLEAAPLADSVYRIRTRQLPERSPAVVEAKLLVATVRLAEGRLTEAATLARDVHEAQRSMFGEGHPAVRATGDLLRAIETRREGG